MNIKVDVKLDNAKLNQLVQAQKQTLEMTTEALKTDIVTSAVVPKQTGELERSGFVDITQLDNGKTSIIFDTPYARRLYWHPEYNFRRDKNINAQGKWMQSYEDGEKKDFAKDTYMIFLKQFSKGLIK
ncbi:minor capsid protein [Clostridium algidicarnis]|uniref:minor capsid protein n=1 Tax=Clostridium algidicarnis TaxID=37659 RepID=UPI001C0DD3CA|nr:minor capsid protein [Clostridium algidicarnis]MBU3226803.1 minor capsid protein [Clostridium algidicarnis]MBU3250286.1 minor capsid protein [Clostridium algidicarnis]